MQNQILKALSILTSHTVRHLLMGGQACVLYGAAQFSRDADLAVLAIRALNERLRERSIISLSAYRFSTL